MKQKQKLIVVLMAGILLTSPLGLIGCARIILHPIAKQDIVQIKSGTSYTSDRDGYFLSNEYVKTVMQIKVDKENLK